MNSNSTNRFKRLFRPICRNRFIISLYCKKKLLKAFSGLFLFSILFTQTAFCSREPPFSDPRIPNTEIATYEFNENGKVFLSTHTTSRENHNGQDAYIINTENYKMIIQANNLRTISVTSKKTNYDGKPELSIIYQHNSEHRVLFKYYGYFFECHILF